MIRHLHLHQDMNYTTIVKNIPMNDLLGDFYEAVLLFLEGENVGTDTIIVCEALLSDELFRVQPQKVYSQNRESSNTPPLISIPSGTYSFEQLLFTPSSKEEFLPLCMKFVSKELNRKSSTFYIRLYKEKRFEITVQFFLPKEPAIT